MVICEKCGKEEEGLRLIRTKKLCNDCYWRLKRDNKALFNKNREIPAMV